jgi:hypothetical protein
VAARETQFAVPHSLGENPFPEADKRYAEWEEFSAVSLQRVARVVQGLQELSAVIDAASYAEWRTQYADAPEAYDLDRVTSWLNTGSLIFRRFDRVAGEAFKKFVHGPEDLKYAERIIERLAGSLQAAIGAPADNSAMSDRVTRWREWWLELAQLEVSPKSAEQFVPAAPRDKWFLPDANFASHTPTFFKSVKSRRLRAIATLRRDMADIVEKSRPKTTDELYRALLPAIVSYAEDLFDASADTKLQNGNPRSYENWLDGCEKAVISDCCEGMQSQFPAAVGLLTESNNERRMPETFRAAIALWGAWNPFSSSTLRDELKNDLNVRLRTQARLRSLAKLHARAAGIHPQKEVAKTPTAKVKRPRARQLLKERSQIRSAWIDKKMDEMQWTSIKQIAEDGGPSANTVTRYRSGAITQQDRSVRGGLAKAFKCLLAEVPS